MAESENLGAKFSIDISDLRAGLAQANRLMRESNSEFKAAAAGMDDWAHSEEGLTAKLKQLTSNLDVQTEVLEAYEKQYEEAGYAQDDMSAAAVELRTKINNQRAAVEKTRREISDYTEQLEQLGSESEDAADSLEEVGEAAEQSGDGFTIAKGAVAGFIANGLTALVGACKNAISSVLGLAESTKETRLAFAKLEQSFDTAGFTAETAEKTMANLYGVLGDTDKATEASNLIAKMSKDQADLDKNTRILTGVFAEFGDSIPTEGLAEGMQATAAMGTVQGVLADALEWQGINLDEYNEQLASMATEEERAAYIQSTLTDLYGKSADTYRENNEAMIDANEAQLEYDKTLGAMGDKIEPITTKLTELKTQGLQWLIEEGLPKAKEGFEWIKNNLAPLGVLIGGVTTAIIAQNAANKIKAVTDLAAANGMTIMKLAQQGLNTAMKANPIGLIITAVTALVGAFMLLWKNCEGFRNFFIGMWEGIKTAVSVVVEWIKENWKTMLLFLVNPVAGVFKYLYEHFEGFRNFVDGVIQGVKDFFTGLWSSIKTGAKGAWDGIKNVFSNVTSWFKDKFTAAWTAVKNVFSTGGKIFSGIKEGIENTFKTVVNKIISGINKIIAVPFNAINKMLNKIRNTSFLNISPFKNLWGENPLTVPVIPQLAKGGIVNGATMAMIGESGKEAIVPLEKNTEWIDKVADKVASKQPKSVIVNQTNNYAQAHSRYELYKSKQQTAAAVRLALQGG